MPRIAAFVMLTALLALPAAAQEAVPREEPGAQGAEPPGARRAVPRGSRPQGDNPRVGTAVPRPARPPAARPDSRPLPPSARDRGNTVIVRPPAVRRYYYPYPSPLYPYGYGAFGLGYFYYDPYRWSTRTFPGYGTYPGYGPGYRPYSSFDNGELRLDVSPRTAQVYVDGYYAGLVDDFDGVFQALKLTAGAYRIDLVAPGYETLSVDVRITPGQKITYRGELQRLRW